MTGSVSLKHLHIHNTGFKASAVLPYEFQTFNGRFCGYLFAYGKVPSILGSQKTNLEWGFLIEVTHEMFVAAINEARDRRFK